MNDWIQALADDIDKRWRARDHQPDGFPEICRKALTAARIHRHLDLRQLVRAMPDLGRQTPHVSANALTLFRSSRLAIFAHLWSDGIGTPHHHAWAGAFQILRGTVIHATFDFEEQSRATPGLRYGRLIPGAPELLAPGDIVAVIPGDTYIHGLWHSERPSLSLSVRSTAATDEMTLDYRFPGVAWRQPLPETPVHQILKLLGFLYRVSPERYRQALGELSREADDETLHLALVHTVSHLGDFDSLKLILDAIEGRPGELVERLESLWHELHRTALFHRVRRNVQSPELRFFFGALYFANDRQAVLDLIARRFPRKASEDPGAEDLVAGWIASVMDPDHSSQAPRDAIETRVSAELFRWMAEGRRLEACLARLEEDGLIRDEGTRSSVVTTYRKIEQSVLFRPLFVEPSAAPQSAVAVCQPPPRAA